MNNVARPSRGHRGGWLARLVQLQLTVGELGRRETPGGDEPTWPAHMIRAGTVLAGLSGLLLVTWLRRRL
jgi:hypothetical protein